MKITIAPVNSAPLSAGTGGNVQPCGAELSPQPANDPRSLADDIQEIANATGLSNGKSALQAEKWISKTNRKCGVAIWEIDGVAMLRCEYPLDGGEKLVGKQWAEQIKAAVDEFASDRAGLKVDEHLRLRFETWE
jgi:hypothetical protein